MDLYNQWIASMGPPPFGGGNHTARRYPPRVPHASMGPPPFGGGNSKYPRTMICPTWLQWGHRLSAVETPIGSEPHRLTIIGASMGPPPFGGGNRPLDRHFS